MIMERTGPLPFLQAHIHNGWWVDIAPPRTLPRCSSRSDWCRHDGPVGAVLRTAHGPDALQDSGPVLELVQGPQ